MNEENGSAMLIPALSAGFAVGMYSGSAVEGLRTGFYWLLGAALFAFISSFVSKK